MIVVENDFQNFGFYRHLAADLSLGAGDQFFDFAHLGRIGAHHDNAGLFIDDYFGTGLRILQFVGVFSL